MKKYKQVTELNGIKVGPATSFNADHENDIEVLRIFPNGNQYTDASEPYYISCPIRGLRYFGIKHFKHSNICSKEE